MKLSRVASRMFELSRRLTFDNHKFWNRRYETDLEKGSGPGSRQENLVLKSSIIKATLDAYDIKTVLDIGCGDIEILQDVALAHYIGVDLSEVVIQRNQDLRPGWTFVCADLTKDYNPPSADLVLCLDVLIHQKFNRNYQMILSKCMRAARKVLLVSGYSKRPRGWNVFFHEPLTKSIQRLYPSAQAEKLAEYRETDLLRVLIPDAA